MRIREIARMAAAFLLAGSALPSTLHAQSPEIIATANVPFAFRLGARTMHEGVYQFRMTANNILQMIGPSDSAFVMVQREDNDLFATMRKGVLVFRHDGGYELETLRAPDHGLTLFCMRFHSKKAAPQEVQAQTVTPKVTVALAEAKP